MRNITVKPNQSMINVVLQALGTLEAGGIFCRDNDVCLTDIPAVGTVYKVSDAAWALRDVTVLKQYQKKQILVANLGKAEDGLPLLNDDTTPLLNDNGTGLLNDN